MIGECCLCGGPLRFWGTDPDSPWGYGNNPDPLGVKDTDRCDACNDTRVLPARLGMTPFGSRGGAR